MVTCCEPESPDQLPPILEVTEQESSSTLVADHVTVLDVPFCTREGSAVIESCGWLTVTLDEPLVVPPEAMQAMPYVVLCVGLIVFEPLSAPPVENPLPCEEE